MSQLLEENNKLKNENIRLQNELKQSKKYHGPLKIAIKHLKMTNAKLEEKVAELKKVKLPPKNYPCEICDVYFLTKENFDVHSTSAHKYSGRKSELHKPAFLL